MEWGGRGAGLLGAMLRCTPHTHVIVAGISSRLTAKRFKCNSMAVHAWHALATHGMCSRPMTRPVDPHFPLVGLDLRFPLRTLRSTVRHLLPMSLRLSSVCMCSKVNSIYVFRTGRGLMSGASPLGMVQWCLIPWHGAVEGLMHPRAH